MMFWAPQVPLAVGNGMQDRSSVCAVQHCPPGRFLLVLAVAASIYLTGLTPLRQMLLRLARVNLPQAGWPPAAAPAAANAPAAAAGHAEAHAAAPAAAPRWSFLAELQAVVIGFISSLVPGEN